MDQATGVAMRELVGVPSEFLFTDYEVGHNLFYIYAIKRSYIGLYVAV